MSIFVFFSSSSKPVNKLGVTKRIYHYNNQHFNSYLFIYWWLSLFILFSVYFIDDESDGVEMGRSSSELSNLNEDWDSGMWRLIWTVHNKHLMTGPEGNSEFCFPRISMFPSTSSRETLRFDLWYSKTKQKQILKNALRFQRSRATAVNVSRVTVNCFAGNSELFRG